MKIEKSDLKKDDHVYLTGNEQKKNLIDRKSLNYYNRKKRPCIIKTYA